MSSLHITSSRPILAFAVSLGFLGGLLFGAFPVAAESGPSGFEPLRRPGVSLVALHGVHTDVVSELPSIQQSGVVLHLSSPSQRVMLHRSWLHLRPAPPRPGGGEESPALVAEVVVDLEGEGELVVDLVSVLGRQAFRDEILLPRQVLRVEGTIRLVREPGGDYEVLLLDLPATLPVRVESALARQVIEMCDRFSEVPLLAIDCASLDHSLSDMEISLPAAGTRFEISAALLGPTEREFLDRHSLDGHGSAGHSSGPGGSADFLPTAPGGGTGP